MGVCAPPSHSPTIQTFRCKQTMTILTKEIMNQDLANKNADNAGDDDEDDEDDNKYSSTTVLSHDPDRETWSPQRQHAQSTSSTTARPTHTTKNMLMCFVLINTNKDKVRYIKTVTQKIQRAIVQSISSMRYKLNHLPHWILSHNFEQRPLPLYIQPLRVSFVLDPKI